MNVGFSEKFVFLFLPEKVTKLINLPKLALKLAFYKKKKYFCTILPLALKYKSEDKSYFHKYKLTTLWLHKIGNNSKLTDVLVFKQYLSNV